VTAIARLTLSVTAPAQAVVSDVEFLPVCNVYQNVGCAPGLAGCKALAGN